MAALFSGLKPERLWKHFEDILQIPHGSGNEKALGDFIIEFAKNNSLECERDKTGNVIIRKPASDGKEKAAGVILQGHLDMVCEKNSDITHDFIKDPIQAEINGEWVQAKGTTLGADNAVGIAAAMAIMEDNRLIHGPLEALFTVEEETGLTGATQIEPGSLKGTMLLNLDSEDEGEFTIGCAGGGDTLMTMPLDRENDSTSSVLNLQISGLKGGHSGVDINLGRANAIKSLARILWQTFKEIPFKLITLEGGNLRNAIPRESWALISVDPAKKNDLIHAAEKIFEQIRTEYRAVEPDAAFSVKDSESDLPPLTVEAQKKFIDYIFSLPHGVLAMHPEMKGLVETSNNVAVVHTHRDKAEIICSTRSSIGSALEAVRASIAALSELVGISVKQEKAYPGWTPNLDSALLKTCVSLYSRIFGKEPHVSAIHAGLECGLIGEKFPGMDMISFGPTIKFPHSPDEKLHIESVEKFWKFLLICLEELTK